MNYRQVCVFIIDHDDIVTHILSLIFLTDQILGKTDDFPDGVVGDKAGEDRILFDSIHGALCPFADEFFNVFFISELRIEVISDLDV